MKAFDGTGWTYLEIATAIGMKALGESIETIGNTLGRQQASVKEALSCARSLVAQGGWPADLLREQDEVERKLRDRAAVMITEPVAPFIPRRPHPMPVLPTPRHGRDVTAVIAGDPSPQRRAYIENQS